MSAISQHAKVMPSPTCGTLHKRHWNFLETLQTNCLFGWSRVWALWLSCIPHVSMYECNLHFMSVISQRAISQHAKVMPSPNCGSVHKRHWNFLETLETNYLFVWSRVWALWLIVLHTPCFNLWAQYPFHERDLSTCQSDALTYLWVRSQKALEFLWVLKKTPKI